MSVIAHHLGVILRKLLGIGKPGEWASACALRALRTSSRSLGTASRQATETGIAGRIQSLDPANASAPHPKRLLLRAARGDEEKNHGRPEHGGSPMDILGGLEVTRGEEPPIPIGEFDTRNPVKKPVNWFAALVFLIAPAAAQSAFVVTPNAGGDNTTIILGANNQATVTTGGVTATVEYREAGANIEILDQTGSVNTVLEGANGSSGGDTGNANDSSGNTFGSWENFEP